MKKSVSVFLVFSILLVLFSACEKYRPLYDGEYELSVRALDKLTGKPISGAQVVIWEVEKNAFLFRSVEEIVVSETDEDGQSNLRFYAKEQSYAYKLGVFKDSSYAKMEISEYIEVSLNKKGKSTIDVTLIPYGYLTFIIKGNKGGHRLSIHGAGRYYFSNSDTLKTVPKRPMSNTDIHYFVYDSSGKLLYNKVDTVFIPASFDTAYHLIEF